MARNLLTVKEIDNSDKAKLRDGDGLWLHRSKTGTRSWVFIYVKNGRRREMGLGSYGSGTGQVSLATARRKADAIREIVGNGGDPFKELPERKVVVKPKTFGEFADQFIEDMVNAGKWRSDKTEASWRNAMSNHAKSIRKIPIADIGTDEVLRVVKPIWAEKNETASKFRERIKVILDAAKTEGLRAGDNPAAWGDHLARVLPTPDVLRKRNHASMPWQDVPAFMIELTKVRGMGSAALQFAILTAARSGEVRGAVWSEFDLDAATWSLPPDRMKMGRAHRVPLTDDALAVIKRMEKQRLSSLVFPGMKKDTPLSDMSLAKALKSAGGGDFTVHGFRSSFRVWAQENGHPDAVAEACLAHQTGNAVERAYARSDLFDRRRTLLQDWTTYCSSEHK
ncbi:site-specific integrase [Phyllobacterium salinisoli]|uniref:Site-specific integrase n=1 Tax=Phyllobacterium salinisoli TaxID=1899321 RepID=A0A368K797_9HYPH|nr:site-specific integrase [Phyllobacterium salinisoli]RCS24515.1 site-specific integrase [Phyllobacterium salinisoli]